MTINNGLFLQAWRVVLSDKNVNTIRQAEDRRPILKDLVKNVTHRIIKETFSSAEKGEI